jgi:chaperonin GroEL
MTNKYSLTKFNEQARKSLLDGAKEVYTAVSTTLGARGRNITIHNHYQTKSIHDGVKVSQSINPKDDFENAGAEMLKESAQRQVSVAGDGTTLAIILGYAIASEAEKMVNAGVNPMALRAGLEKGCDLLVKEIKKLSTPVTSKEQKVQIATIASQNKELGELIGDTLHRAGVEGVITIEEAIGSETFVEHKEGVQIDSGFKTDYFITNPHSMTATVSKAKILVTDYKLNDIHELVPLFKNVIETNGVHNIVIISEDIEGTVLATLAQNKIQGKLNTLAIKAPTFQQEQVLRDIATIVGAKFISQEMTIDLKELTIDDLGYADQVTSSRTATVIVGGGGKDTAVKERIDSIKSQLEEEENEFNKQKLRERLAKLTGGVYVVYVGGQTEVEMVDRKERIDDAIQATRAAMKEGIIPGGEIVFLGIDKVLKPKNDDEDYAFRILKNALKKPFEKLVENAGFNAGQLQERLSKELKGMGIDVTTGEIVNMVEKGIIDPTLVATEAIRNGVSVAISIILSGGTVCEIEEEKGK